MKTIFRSLASLIPLFMAAPAFAHEGHGHPQWVRSALHYLIEPEHLSLILPAILLALLFSMWSRRRSMQSRAKNKLPKRNDTR